MSASLIPLTNTPEDREIAERLVPGMAHWKGSGPPGCICRTCGYLVRGRRKGMSRCQRFQDMTGRQGPDLPSDALPSCRFYQPKQ